MKNLIPIPQAEGVRRLGSQSGTSRMKATGAASPCPFPTGRAKIAQTYRRGKTVERLQPMEISRKKCIPSNTFPEKLNLISRIFEYPDGKHPPDAIEQFDAPEREGNTAELTPPSRPANVAKPRIPTKFREWRPKVHLRQAEIDAIPHRITISNAGYASMARGRSKK